MTAMIYDLSFGLMVIATHTAIVKSLCRHSTPLLVRYNFLPGSKQILMTAALLTN
jgi:hypothetical protein